MTPIELLKLVLEPLKKEDCLFALCGGVASSVYRSSFRVTNDVDIALFFPPEIVGKSEREFAIQFLERLGIKPSLGWIPGIKTDSEDAVFLIVGELGGFLPTVDFLLPSLPWVKQAVIRAQNNRIDFGFGSIPTITPEDLLISKAFALSIEPNRLQDQDDIASILEGESVKDPRYLEENLKKLGLSIAI